MKKAPGCDPDGVRLPIKIDSASNGEFMPRPLERHNQISNALALQRADANRRRLGQSRRDFLISSCGAATTLLAMNEVRAAAGQAGSYFAIPAAAALEEAAAASVLEGSEFIFDVQGHHIGDFEKWRIGIKRSLSFGFRFFAPHHGCDYRLPNDAIGGLNCLTGDAYIKEVFLDSDTQLAVLSTG
ncbi:MAG: amidohydrolase, partial [Gammaproteobacteria bacterium]